MSGQRRSREFEDGPIEHQHHQHTPIGGGRMTNAFPAAGGRGRMDRGGSGGRATMSGGRVHRGGGGGGRFESPAGRGGPEPKRMRYDHSHPPVEPQGYEPNVEETYDNNEEYPNPEYDEHYDDGSGYYYEAGYDEGYHQVHTPHYAGGRGWYRGGAGGSGRFYRGGRGYGRGGGHSYVSPGGRYAAGRGYPVTTDETTGDAVVAELAGAATEENAAMDDVTASVVAAHPSPLVSAAYRGRGGAYPFVRGGRGRGRFPGRVGFGGRADVKTLIASKTWVRTKPGDETKTDVAGDETKNENVDG